MEDTPARTVPSVAAARLLDFNSAYPDSINSQLSSAREPIRAGLSWGFWEFTSGMIPGLEIHKNFFLGVFEAEEHDGSGLVTLRSTVIARNNVGIFFASNLITGRFPSLFH